jgi:SRSO17 transposase
LSNVEHKNIESIAYRFGQSRLPLQGFMGGDGGDDAPVRQELPGPIRRHLGQGDGVLVCAPSGFPTSDQESVGVARQWCGRLGKVDTCQVALSVGSVSRKGHPLVDARRSLPKDWTTEPARMDKAGVPTTSRASRTRHHVV